MSLAWAHGFPHTHSILSTFAHNLYARVLHIVDVTYANANGSFFLTSLPGVNTEVQRCMRLASFGSKTYMSMRLIHVRGMDRVVETSLLVPLSRR